MKKTLLTFSLLFCIAGMLSAQTRSTSKSKQVRSSTAKTQKKKPVSQHKKKKVVASKPALTKKKNAKIRNSKSVAPVKLRPSLKSKNPIKPVVEEDKASIEFTRSRGKMAWPVEGVVSIPFGEYTVERTRIKGKNPGITISTEDKSVPVKSVFEGVVYDVDDRGEVATVYIRHGKYYTVYSNLSAIHVKKGTTVKTGETIGEVGEAYGAPGGELTFVVMNETDNVNPSFWLSN